MGFGPYENWARYGMSKLCNVLFMKELARKIKSKGLEDKVITLACHPGHANTNLQNVAKDSMTNWEKSNAGNAQSAPDGSLPLLMATISKDVNSGDHTGPKNTSKGPPIVMAVGGCGDDEEMAKELWKHSEECIKAAFDVQLFLH